ncbi:MAG: DUF2075 domain-containing protein [Holophagaceae bacterium]|nr:DUF2075 domain-containing protein [Holophagaceae bacterium]
MPRIDDEVRVALEYHISAAGRFRIDALLAGNDGLHDNGMIVELKAWDTVAATDIPDIVFAPIGGGTNKEHPVLQASKYKGMILNFNLDVREQGFKLHPMAYLFNLQRRNPEPLEDPRYSHLLERARLFLAGDVDQLRKYIEQVVPRKPKKDLFFFLENGRLRPSDELIERVGSMLEGNDEFTLIDEQNVAFQVIKHHLLPNKAKSERQVFIVEGGPGTGKSVIAVQLMAEILKQRRMGFFVAPNSAFRETLIEYLGKGNKGYRHDGQALFLSSWSFHDTDWDRDKRFEVLVVDEAHRLKDSSAHMYKGENMVEDMVRSSQISVFFIDESQRVSWGDIGSIAQIKAAAKKFGATVMPTHKLTSQFRCNGSDSYLNWLDDCLQIRSTAEYDTWGDTQYEFKVFDRAEDLYAALSSRNGQNKARLVAGYSWEWPSEGRQRGTMRTHVEADGLALPWNFHGENWATSKDGISQVGCVHTSQGLEFDWLGVLIGEDLIYKDGRVQADASKRAKSDKSLKGSKKALKEAGTDAKARQVVLDRVDLIVKSTYKVLLSRGRKGCFVWCADPALREYLKARLALVVNHDAKPAVVADRAQGKEELKVRGSLPFTEVPETKLERYVNALPVVNLKFAAGTFSAEQNLDEDSIVWVEPPEVIRPATGLFIAQVVGESMNRRIPNGSWCVFKLNPSGTRQGKVVVARHNSIHDPDFGGEYTVKLYQSEKATIEIGEWQHTWISLSPDSTDPSFKPIELTPGDDEFKIVAELVAVLS